jgi:hypothetical protein
MEIHQQSVRTEVHNYLQACVNLLMRAQRSRHEFMLASRTIQAKTGEYTVHEMILIQEMLHRVSNHLGR